MLLHHVAKAGPGFAMTSGVFTTDGLSGPISAERTRCRSSVSRANAGHDTAGPAAPPAADPSYTWPVAAAGPAPSTLLL
ncbi:hypothetical protein GT755_30690 [Herbidospora sp. NEAU-GS84]|uniref:Uncharacterized protein n=1 Tax=Herbidospora solisilvae TaxID=2696284 RepID=A0A7C9J6V7_9ACTN|nr:hypothetical protein [Herbidospora solisilvae]NAS26025.1 hypothetical protein [Herbidospora solisilvae]